MIKFHLIVFKIITFVDNFADLLRDTNFSFQICLSENVTCDKVIKIFLEGQTNKGIHYTRKVSHGFTVPDN